MIVESFPDPVPEHIAAALVRLGRHYEIRKDRDVLRTYARALERRAISEAVLDAAIERVLETRTFFPSLSELLEDIDHVLSARVPARPFTPCEACEPHPGWIEVEASGAITTQHLGRSETRATRSEVRLARCACYVAWQRGLLPGGGQQQAPADRGSVERTEDARPGFASVSDFAHERMRGAR